MPTESQTEPLAFAEVVADAEAFFEGDLMRPAFIDRDITQLSFPIDRARPPCRGESAKNKQRTRNPS